MQRLAAIVLAAGESLRFGGPSKLLADVGGEAMIRRTVAALRNAPVQTILVITGRDHYGLVEALRDCDVEAVQNPDWAEGMGGSIAAGIKALPSGTFSGVFIVPGDMPKLTPEVFQRISNAFSEAGATKIIYPQTAGGEQRNPVLWPERFFADLSAQHGPRGAKKLLRDHLNEAIAVNFSDDTLFADIDTQQELAALIADGSG